MKDAVPKDNPKRAVPRPARPSGGKERKQRQPDRRFVADPDTPQPDRLAATAEGAIVDKDVEAIFAPDPPLPEREQTLPQQENVVPSLDQMHVPLPRRQGMGRWFMGVALCILGSGYVAWQVVNETVPPRAASIPAAAETAPAARLPPVDGGETIHKLPQATAPVPALPSSRKPDHLPSDPPRLVPAAVAPPVPEPSPARKVQAVAAAPAAAISEAEEGGGADVAAAPDGAPAAAVITPPSPELQVIRDCSQCPELIVIPAGKFLMGSPADEPGHQPHEAPQHEVVIAAPFAIGRYEVTFAEWDMCVSEGGCRNRADDDGWGRARMPAINVSWRDIAEDFLPWLSGKSGKSYRLPSEAEWEYAVRAGSGLTRTAAYGHAGVPGGLCGFANAADNVGQGSDATWTTIDCRDGFAHTAPVGSFKPNSWGLHDLVGNVWEWVGDCWNETYRAAPFDGSAWMSGDCGLRVVRGGSWSSDAEKLRAADRGWNPPAARNPSIGFRVARKL